MSDVEFGGFFVQLVTAGNDTTKGMLSAGLLTLLRHPDQLADLRADPALLAPAVGGRSSATTIRCTTSGAPRSWTPSWRECGHHGGGQGGDVLHLGQPRRTRLRRPAGIRHPPPAQPPSVLRHGRSLLLGAHLARLEGRVFFQELLDAFGTIELLSDPVRVRSNLNNSLKTLLVSLD